MGGQTIGRRELMRLMGLAATAAAYPGFRAWAFGDAPRTATDGVATDAAGEPLKDHLMTPWR